MTTITATGSHGPERPTARITGGDGNTSQPEVRIIMRAASLDGETSHALEAWFDAADLTDAIAKATRDNSLPSIDSEELTHT